MSEGSRAGHQKIIKDSSHYISSSIGSQIFGIIRSISMPILLNPGQLGVWSIMNVVLNYSANAQLGILHGMNKEIPYLKGLNKTEEVENIKDSVFWLNFFLGLLSLISILIVSFYVQPSYALPLRIVSIISFVQLLFYYLYSLLRANSQFILVSKGVFSLSILTTILVLVLAFISKNSLLGGLIGLGLANVLIVVYWFIKGNYRFAFSIKAHSIKRAFMLGIPIIIIGILDSLFISVDRWVIANSMNETKLGYYALAVMASSMLSLIPGAFASVLYPRMLERFAINKDPKDVLSLLIGPMRVTWAFMTLLIASAAVFLPLIIQFIIPKYISAIPLIEILIGGAFFMSAAQIPANYLIAINKQKMLVYIQIFAACFIVGVDTLLVKLGFGLTGVAVGTACGYTIYGLGYTLYAMLMVFSNRLEIAKWFIRKIIPFATLVILFLITEYFLPKSSSFFQALFYTVARYLVILIFLLPALWLVNRDGVILSFAPQKIKNIFSRKSQIDGQEIS